jgi:VanZ family protein
VASRRSTRGKDQKDTRWRNKKKDYKGLVINHMMKESNLGHVFIYEAPVLAYAGLIFLLSSLSKFPDVVPSFFGFDKLAHFSEYYFFGCLICRWFLADKGRFANRHFFVLTIVIGTCYGLSDEWHQSFVPGRHASLWDVFFDFLGVITAAFTYPLITKRIPFWKKFL